MIGLLAEQMVIIRAGPECLEEIAPHHSGVFEQITQFQHVAAFVNSDRDDFQRSARPEVGIDPAVPDFYVLKTQTSGFIFGMIQKETSACCPGRERIFVVEPGMHSVFGCLQCGETD